MEWLLLVVIILILVFGLVIFVGAPFLPTLKAQSKEALKLLDLKPDQLLVELGSGEGTVLREAARLGIRAIGYEINPFLVVYSKIVCWPNRKLIKIYWKNFWGMSVSEADGIYVFLLDKFMPRLDNKISQEIKKSTKIVSFAFSFPERKVVKESKGLKLYIFKP